MQISSGKNHSCALTESAKAICWGDGTQGQIGSDKYEQESPGKKIEIESVISLAAGGDSTCVEIAKESFNELKNRIKSKRIKSDEDELLLMKNVIIGKSFSTKFNYDFVKDNFLEIMNSIENDIMVSLLLESIKVFNVEFSKSSIKGKKELFYRDNVSCN